MRIFVAQINPTVADLKGNTDKILAAIAKARESKADLVLFSELALTGYPPEDFLLLPSFIQEVERQLARVVEASKGIAVAVGVPRKNEVQREKSLSNSVAVIDDGILVGYQDKSLLPTYDVFDERRYFEPGHGAGVWHLCGKKVAITICEDLWQHAGLVRWSSYHHDPVKELIALHPDVVLNLSASPFHVGKENVRLSVFAKAAQTLHCPVVLCNQVGANDSLIFDGNSLHIGADGKLRQQAKSFEEDALIVDLERELPPTVSSSDEIGDLYRALVLGVRDYFFKQGFSKACLGLSGGVDSALVACIAVEALGSANVLGLAMPSRFSSAGSLADAEALASTLKIPLKRVPIEAPFQCYLDLLTSHFEGRSPDATEENLQARIRGMILMAFSNKFGYLLLSTGNKSEVALGYSTLYGDMCGGLSVIADVTKRQVYALSRWINREGEVIPHSTIEKAPSAELRPNQKDSDSLPDYEIIDNVLKDYVEDLLAPEEVAARHGYSLELVNDLIRRIHRNEYKRRQGPPGLRVTEKAFSAGRRFPIVQKWV